MKDATPLEEAIRVGDRWYVLATSSREGDPIRVLKYGDGFALFDRFGDIPRAGSGEHGFYHQGTRYLARYELRLNGMRPLILHSSVRRDNSALAVDATNQDVYEDGKLVTVKGTVHLARSWALWQATCHERLQVANFGGATVRLRLSLEFGADFADIFEVRGYDRRRRGEDLPPEAGGAHATLAYAGLDGVERRTRIEFSTPPTRIDATRAEFEIDLAPRGRHVIEALVACDPEPRRSLAGGALHVDYGAAARHMEQSLGSRHGATAQSPNEQFNDWIERSAADLSMLTVGNPEGCYPYAGVPWYSVPFGRDGILTALQYLWVDPEMARGVLDFLARTQADAVKPEQDAEPG
ncbi:MAG TPA: glycogen debranching N-terminal domain-containing protein, partial [Usitatibacter sp.]|nr:glycogen debranching N-terminal domain-containing protein [Usitatibacter sp.]